MALFGGDEKALQLLEDKIKLEAALEVEQQRNADFKERIRVLEGQVERLQDALVAKVSPEAYQDQMAAKEAPSSKEMEEEQHRRVRQGEVNRELLTLQEGDLFKDADEMIDILTRGQGAPEFASQGHDES